VPGKQISNLARIQFWQSALSDVERETGSYPETLEQALVLWETTRPATARPLSWDPLQDNWGHLLQYIRASDGYLLASYGRDGRCDMHDLRAYGSATIIDESPCYAADRDTVLTDQGFVKGCGK
jgi:hypothetical protein